MSDITSILAAAYKSDTLSVAKSNSKYVAVDPKLYQGSWTGKYANNKSFSITVSDVSGFHAKVHYQSEGTSKYQDVLIKDNSFRIGDSKFLLKKIGHAQIKTVVTNPATGASTLNTAYADLV